MIRRVREYIVANKIFRPGDRLVVAVSGGADSVALLDILASCGMDLSLVVAHFDHQLRGEESDADAAFVRELALRYRLPLRESGADVLEISRISGRGLEDAGREVRYAFLRQMMEEESASAVALGHHADDQAETVLMRLLRGAGPRGLSGMTPRSGWKARPLLALRREEIESYLRERSLPWRDDSSNTDERFLRNRVRHRLMPDLETYNPGIVPRLFATGAVCAAENEVVETLSREAFARLARVERGEVEFPLDGLRTELQGVRLRLFDAAVREVLGSAAGFGSAHLLAIDMAVTSSRPHLSLSLPGITVSRDYRSIFFRSSACVPADPMPFRVEIPGEGLYRLPDGRKISVTAGHSLPAVAGQDLRKAFFDPAAAPFPWTLRNFHPGDRIVPFGMSGTKKVKDLFIDLKVSQVERRSVPLLFDGSGNLLWICGLRRSSLAPVTPGTTGFVGVEFPTVRG